jgi:serine/threonine-protein kinase
VVGRYALYGEIAAGGMATVHYGRLLGPVGFSRTVAIKRLHPQFAKDPEFVAMFLDEARLAARIRHPNVVPTLDVVALDGELFLIMEYVQGESLAKLARRRPVPRTIVAGVMCGALHGLHAAHEARDERGEPLDIVHRDVSPQNILVGTDGVARVLDFGIAKASGRMQTTKEGHIKGKLSYMAPEQLRGAVTRRTDVYAASIVVWEALTGQRLFAGGDDIEVLGKALAGKVAPPSSIIADLPPALDEVVLKGLAPDPHDRYATAREMALELERCSGIASPSEVGDWVDKSAAEVLMRRSVMLQSIEAATATGALRALEDVPTLLPDGATPVTEQRDAPVAAEETATIDAVLADPPPRTARRWVVAVVGAFGVAACLLAARLLLQPSHEDGARASTPPNVPSATAPTAPMDDGGAAADPTAAPQATATKTAAPATADPAANGAHTARRVAATPAAATGAALPAKPVQSPIRKDCDPPYSVDAAGHKHYKVECL